jgi:hypothetical protein
MTTPLEQAQAILGEHYRNYVIIAQPEEFPHSFEFVCSDSFATTGLLMESLKYHDAVMNTFQPTEDAFEWLEEEEGASDEEEDWL